MTVDQAIKNGPILYVFARSHNVPEASRPVRPASVTTSSYSRLPQVLASVAPEALRT